MCVLADTGAVMLAAAVGPLPPGSPGSSRGASPSPRAQLGARSPSPQLGSAADAVGGLRANSSPNMQRLLGARPGAASPVLPAGYPIDQQLRTSMNDNGKLWASDWGVFAKLCWWHDNKWRHGPARRSDNRAGCCVCAFPMRTQTCAPTLLATQPLQPAAAVLMVAVTAAAAP